jgi:hypothetical protein
MEGPLTIVGKLDTFVFEGYLMIEIVISRFVLS